MSVDTPSLFTKVIEEHLALKRRNSELERQMPLQRYKSDDPFSNHPLFKTEEQARLEETMDGLENTDVVAAHPAFAWPGEEALVPSSAEDEDTGLWSRSRDFDWGT